MSKKIPVDYSQLLKIRNDIDGLLGTNTPILPTKNLSHIKEVKKIDYEYELDSLEKDILNYITNNPSTSKENIVKNLGKSSRVPILRKIKYLQNIGYIIVKKNETNSQIHELYYNDENSLSVLIKNLEDFKKTYFILLDNIKNTLVELSRNCEKQMKIIIEASDTNNTDLSCGNLQALYQHIISPLRNLILILLYSSFIPFNLRMYNENAVVGKLSIINDFIKDVIIKLIEIFPKSPKWQIDNEVSVIQGLEYEMLPSSIEKNINFFSIYILKERAEDLWESIWKLIYPFLRLFNFYVRIGGIMKRNSVTSIRKLLNIKHQFEDIEKHYKDNE